MTDKTDDNTPAQRPSRISSQRLPPVKKGSAFKQDSRDRLETTMANSPVRVSLPAPEQPYSSTAAKSPPAPPPGPVIDAVKLLAAWEANVETQREIIRVVEKNEAGNILNQRSNDLTRVMLVIVLVALGTSMYFMHSKGLMIVEAVDRIELVAARAGTEINDKMQVVAEAMAKLNEAEILASEAEAAKASARALHSQRGRSRSQTPPGAPEQEKAAQRARMEALATSLTAQEQLMDPLLTAGVRARKAKLKRRAADAGFDLDL